MAKITLVIGLVIASVIAAANAESKAAEVCRKGFEAAKAAAKNNPKLVCGALHSLSACAANSLAVGSNKGNQDQETEKDHIIRWADSNLFANNCGGSDTEESYISKQMKKADDIEFFRGRRQAGLSIWEVKSRLAARQANLASDIDKILADKLDKATDSLVSSLVASTAAVHDQLNKMVESSKEKTSFIKAQVIESTEQQTATDIGSVEASVSGKKAAILKSLDNIKVLKQMPKVISDAKAAIAQKVAKTSDNVGKSLTEFEDKVIKAFADSKTGKAALDLNKPFYAMTQPKLAYFKWKQWHTYDQSGHWIFDNRREFYGGIHPSQWTDSNQVAWNMDGNKDVLRVLFTDTMSCSSRDGTCHIYSKDNYQYSTTDSNVMGVWMRIKNNKPDVVKWSFKFRVSGCHNCQGGQQNRASIAINGKQVWGNGGTTWTGQEQNINMDVPGNRVSSIIFIANGAHDSGDLQTTAMGFESGALKLPDGLEFVFDHDYAAGGWEQ